MKITIYWDVTPYSVVEVTMLKRNASLAIASFVSELLTLSANRLFLRWSLPETLTELPFTFITEYAFLQQMTQNVFAYVKAISTTCAPLPDGIRITSSARIRNELGQISFISISVVSM
jgi:hypothetical protein